MSTWDGRSHPLGRQLTLWLARLTIGLSMNGFLSPLEPAVEKDAGSAWLPGGPSISHEKHLYQAYPAGIRRLTGWKPGWWDDGGRSLMATRRAASYLSLHPLHKMHRGAADDVSTEYGCNWSQFRSMKASSSHRSRISIHITLLYGRWDVKRFLEVASVDIFQPDISHSGDISEIRRIAAMAETYDVAIAPHCPLGPVVLAAGMQVDFVNAGLCDKPIHYNTTESGGEYDVTNYGQCVRRQRWICKGLEWARPWD
ncbi:putative galactonate dehydratase [Microsporum audouinii]